MLFNIKFTNIGFKTLSNFSSFSQKNYIIRIQHFWGHPSQLTTWCQYIFVHVNDVLPSGGPHP